MTPFYTLSLLKILVFEKVFEKSRQGRVNLAQQFIAGNQAENEN